MSDSVVFDRAAEIYDATRGLPADVSAGIAEVLAEELSGRGRCLEIGVGTGRIAMPLHAAGIELAGVDLSAAMVGKFREKAGGTMPFPVALADATRLPFADGSYGAALTCHVLHLVPAWRDVLAEIVRVVRGGGVYLNDMGVPPGGWMVFEEVFMRAAGLTRRHPGADGREMVEEAMAALGARGRDLPAVSFTRTVSLERYFQRIESNAYSWTWPLDDATRMRAAATTRTWAAENVRPLDEPFEIEIVIGWRAYDLA